MAKLSVQDIIAIRNNNSIHPKTRKPPIALPVAIRNNQETIHFLNLAGRDSRPSRTNCHALLPRNNMKLLSDWEFAVLGVIWQDGPCTPYRVLKTFRDSMSAYWSASTGSIYPIIARLQKRKLILSSKQPKRHQTASQIKISAKGKSELAKSLAPDRQLGGELMAFDPLRLRVRHLGILNSRGQKQFLDAVQKTLRKQLESVRADAVEKKKQDDLFASLMAEGARQSIQGQLKWIDHIRKTLAKSSSS